MDLGVLVAGMPEPVGLLVDQWVVSSVIGNGTLSDQSVVVALNGVFNDRREGGGLVGGLAVLLNGGHEFHHLIREADSELFGCVRMLFMWVCRVWQGMPPAPRAVLMHMDDPRGGVLE